MSLQQAIQLRQQGYTIQQLKDSNYTDDIILRAGYTASQLKIANYSGSQLLRYGYSEQTLLSANYSYDEIYSETINKLYPTWIKSVNNINATYNNVSFYTQGKADLGEVTTKSLGINKNSGGNYVLDISGNAFIDGSLATVNATFTNSPYIINEPSNPNQLAKLSQLTSINNSFQSFKSVTDLSLNTMSSTINDISNTMNNIDISYGILDFSYVVLNSSLENLNATIETTLNNVQASLSDNANAFINLDSSLNQFQIKVDNSFNYYSNKSNVLDSSYNALNNSFNSIKNVTDISFARLDVSYNSLNTNLNDYNITTANRLNSIDSSFTSINTSLNRLSILDSSFSKLDVSYNSFKSISDASFTSLTRNIDISNAFVKWQPYYTSNTRNINQLFTDCSTNTPTDGSGVFLCSERNGTFTFSGWSAVGTGTIGTKINGVDTSGGYSILWGINSLGSTSKNNLSTTEYVSSKSSYGNNYVALKFTKGNTLYFETTTFDLSAGYYKLSFGVNFLAQGSTRSNIGLVITWGTNTLRLAGAEIFGWQYYDLFLLTTANATNNIRFTFNDNFSATNGISNYVCISPLIITKAYGNLVSSGTTYSFISNTESYLNNPRLIGNTNIEGDLNINGALLLRAKFGYNNICLHPSFGSTFDTNSNVIRIGNTLGTTTSVAQDTIMIGSNMGSDNSQVVNNVQNTILIGTRIRKYNKYDIMIGNILTKTNTAGDDYSVIIGNNTGGAYNNNGYYFRTNYTVSIGSFNFACYNPTTTALHSVAIGSYALGGNNSDRYNTAVGGYALYTLVGGVQSGGNSQYNTAVGYQSGRSSGSLNFCTFLGSNAESTTSGVSYVTAVGYNAKANANYATSIGAGVINSTANSVRIGRSADIVQIDGSLNLVGSLVSGSVTLTPTKLSYLDASSSLQTQVNLRAYDASVVHISSNETITGIKTFNAGTLKVANKYINYATSSYITDNTTITKPFNSYYACDGSTNDYTITLPTIDVNDLGSTITFRRVRTNGTDGNINFIGNGTQKVYQISSTIGSASAVSIMSSSIHSVTLVALPDPSLSPTNYSWYEIKNA